MWCGGDPGRSLIERLLLRPLLSWDQHVGINPTALGPPFYLCLMVGGLEPRLVLGVIETAKLASRCFHLGRCSGWLPVSPDGS